MAKRDNGIPGLRPVDHAVATAVTESHRGFLRFFERQTGDAARRVLQGFFVKVLGGARQQRQIENVRSWLGCYLQDTLAEQYGKCSARGRGNGKCWSFFGRSALLDEDIDSAVRACLYALLPTLKPEYAEILWRVDLADEPREQVAALLETTVNNVGVRLFRARNALRKRLLQVCLICPIHGSFDCRCEYASTMRAALGNGKDREATVVQGGVFKPVLRVVDQPRRAASLR